MNLLIELEASAFSEWLTLSILGFPTLIALHSVGMAVVVGLSLIVTLRLHGLITGIDDDLAPRLLTLAIWGFTLNFLTGVLLFITRGSEYIASYTFLSKMLLVLIGAVILFGLRNRLTVEQPIPGGLATDKLARTMSLVGTTAWFGAVVAGRLIAYLSDLYR